MKAGVVLMMLDDSPSQRGGLRVGIVDPLLGPHPPHAHAAIGGRQPIGRGSAGQKIRLVKKRAAMREIVHLA